MKNIKEQDLSKFSSLDLINELTAREDIALIQWFQKSHLKDILEDAEPTKEEINAYLAYLRHHYPYADQISINICEDFYDFREENQN